MSSTESRLAAEPRTEFGKGAARRVRRSSRVPAVIYGHGMDPLHVTLPGHDTMMALKYRNAVIQVALDGTTHVTLARHVQRDPIRGSVEHVDLIVVTRDEKVRVDIPVTTTGAGTSDAVVTIEQPTISVEAPATQLPESVEVDVTGFTPGTQVLARDLALPEGVALAVDPETVVVHAVLLRSASAEEDEAAAGDTGV
ncbi:MAG: 50S ribosomal protein L25/general stress protein Ctc [Kineosporiaceae bacterium]